MGGTRASIPSRCAGSTCEITSREIAAMIGRIITPRIRAAASTDWLNWPARFSGSANSGIQPKWSARKTCSGTIRLSRK